MDTPLCQPGECSFSRSRDTNEPVGRCFDCGSTVAQAEARWEDGEPVVPVDDQEPGPLCKHTQGPECRDCR